MKRVSLILLVFFIGCAPTEIARLFGVGTERFRTHGRLHKQVIDKDYDYCYSETLTVLGKKMGGNFYLGSKKKHYVIFTNLNRGFPQAIAATELIVFFREISDKKTELEVSSLNYSLSDYAASKVFDWLEGKREGLFPEELEEETEDKEDEDQGLKLGDGLW